MVSPAARRRAVVHVRGRLARVSERRACRALGVARASCRYRPRGLERDRQLVRRMRALSSRHPRYGYRRIWARLREEGFAVNRKRVQRLWRQEALAVPRKQLKRRRLGAAEAGCAQRRASGRNDVWSMDFVADRTSDGRALRILTVLDEHTRLCVALTAARSIVGGDVLQALLAAMRRYGVPRHVRCDNGPEFVGRTLRQGLAALGVGTLYIEPGSPWQNGHVESLHSRLRDELLRREDFDGLRDAAALLKDWRVHYNTRRPHSALGYLTPAAYAARAGAGSAPLRRLPRRNTTRTAG
jgi:transposase InsO family protein